MRPSVRDKSSRSRGRPRDAVWSSVDRRCDPCPVDRCCNGTSLPSRAARKRLPNAGRPHARYVESGFDLPQCAFYHGGVIVIRRYSPHGSVAARKLTTQHQGRETKDNDAYLSWVRWFPGKRRRHQRRRRAYREMFTALYRRSDRNHRALSEWPSRLRRDG